MASNETVEEIKYRIYSHWRGCENCSLEEMDGADLIAIADQFEAAHKREILVERHLTDEYLAVTNAEIEKLRDTINMDSASMAGKDAVIAELRERIKEADEFATEMKQSTNSLVRACGHQMILRLAAKRR